MHAEDDRSDTHDVWEAEWKKTKLKRSPKRTCFSQLVYFLKMLLPSFWCAEPASVEEESHLWNRLDLILMPLYEFQSKPDHHPKHLILLNCNFKSQSLLGSEGVYAAETLFLYFPQQKSTISDTFDF